MGRRVVRGSILAAQARDRFPGLRIPVGFLHPYRTALIGVPLLILTVILHRRNLRTGRLPDGRRLSAVSVGVTGLRSCADPVR